MNFTILHFDSIDSTNTEALKQARLGADEGLCIVARQQIAGRGRHGRAWVSEKDAGLYFSIVLRPKSETKFLPLITLMAGVAVHDTLAELGLRPDIKWVNDILINEKKICGILAETSETENGPAVIVGIGINLNSRSFPPEIADIATSVEAESVPPPPLLPEEGWPKAGVVGVAGGALEESLVHFLSYFYEILQSENGPAEILRHWRQRSSYYFGKKVRVVLQSETITGLTDGLEANGALRVRRADGSVTIIQAGDVEQIRAS